MPTAGKKCFVAQLTSGQQIQEIFLVARKALAETKAGKPYLALGLMDRTGEIEARLWDNALQFDAQAEEGKYVLVQGVAKPFRDQLQLVVQSLSAVGEDRVVLADFMPASLRPLPEMAAELENVLDSISDPPLRALLRVIFQGETLARFQRAPAAKKMHHAYIGGLMEHTLSLVALATKVAGHYPLLDKDMLVAGALLHDLAKIEEFDYSQPAFSYTDRGRLVGHLVLGVELVRRAAAKVEGVSPERVDHLLHLILSHHGQHAFGSPVLPMTPEALILHHLDDMDAKMNYLEGLRGKMTGTGWQWTEYQRHLERYLYLRAGHASEEAPLPGEEPAEEIPEVELAPASEPPRPPAPRKSAPNQRQQSLF